MTDERSQDDEQQHSSIAGAAAYCRDNPSTVVILGAATVGGAIGALYLPFEDLSTMRRLLGGAIAGFYFGLFPLGFRLFN